MKAIVITIEIVVIAVEIVVVAIGIVVVAIVEIAIVIVSAVVIVIAVIVAGECHCNALKASGDVMALGRGTMPGLNVHERNKTPIVRTRAREIGITIEKILQKSSEFVMVQMSMKSAQGFSFSLRVRVVMSKNEHAVNMANKLINTLTRHCLGIGAAEVDTILSSKINASCLS